MGYDRVNPLTAEEKQAVYYVICAAAMNGIVYCSDMLDVTDRNLKALVFLAENKEIFLNLV